MSVIQDATHAAMRRLILGLANDPRAQTWMRKYGMRLGAQRFVAGETLDECLATLRTLEVQGFLTNTTLLGEAVSDPAAVETIVREYLAILDRLAAASLRTRLAVKLTHLGLNVDEDLAYGNVARLVSRAHAHGQFVRIDMEDSPRTDATLRIYRRLRTDGHDNVGTVLQSSLRRAEQDLRALLPLQPNLRFVKGAYLEPPAVAFPRKSDVDQSLVRLITVSLTGGGYTAVATHDARIIAHTIAFIQEHHIAPDQYEFQMLFGVRPQLQQELLRRGHRVMVATPFGAEWYPYLTRRLAERPANVLFFLKHLVRR